MNINRRAFLKAAPVAAAGAALAPAVALPAVASTPAVDAAPAAVAAVEKYPWQWWAGYEETLHEQCATREEAIEVARENGYPFIAECKSGDFYLKIDADEVLERLAETNTDVMNEDSDFLDYTPEQEEDLSRRLTAALHEWVTVHGINTRAYIFAGIRNDEYIPDEDDAAPPQAEDRQ